jgi:tetratricopeptide (TPR) repeat protein
MKRRLILCVVTAIVAALCVPAAWSQMAPVKGYVHDVDGNPIPGAGVQLVSTLSGRKYEMKTDKQGEYYSVGVADGRYDLTVLKDGKPIWKLSNIKVRLGEENIFNIDLKKEQAAEQSQISPEQRKKREEQIKEAAKIKSLNEKLAQARAAQDAGNPQQAAVILTEATQLDPSQPVIWAALAETERAAAGKQTDPAEKKAAYTRAVEDYKKALALKPNGSYYNNMGDAQAKSGDAAAAIASYDQAAQIDPPNAAQYYFNEGAVLTNTGKVDEAIQAFDMAVKADPTRADAYYWKGVNLLGKATIKGDKMQAPPGTVEAFNKYLELQPTGQFAEPAKQMLASIGAPVETSFGKGKGTKTKK